MGGSDQVGLQRAVGRLEHRLVRCAVAHAPPAPGDPPHADRIDRQRAVPLDLDPQEAELVDRSPWATIPPLLASPAAPVEYRRPGGAGGGGGRLPGVGDGPGDPWVAGQDRLGGRPEPRQELHDGAGSCEQVVRRGDAEVLEDPVEGGSQRAAPALGRRRPGSCDSARRWRPSRRPPACCRPGRPSRRPLLWQAPRSCARLRHWPVRPAPTVSTTTVWWVTVLS